MKFDQPLVPGTLVRRYKRFLVDVDLDRGERITAHTPNTGSMMGCSDPGMRVWLSVSDNPKRKYAHTLELVQNKAGTLIGVHTQRPNALVHEAIESGCCDLGKVADIRREVPYGSEGKSRIDLLLQWENGQLGYLEVKNVTLAKGGQGYFPDAVTARGTKHLAELSAMVEQGHRAFIAFCVQRDDIDRVQAARDIDPVYANALSQAVAAGVEPLALRFDVQTEGIEFERCLPVDVH